VMRFPLGCVHPAHAVSVGDAELAGGSR
jgi:hypothetical protein